MRPGNFASSSTATRGAGPGMPPSASAGASVDPMLPQYPLSGCDPVQPHAVGEVGTSRVAVYDSPPAGRPTATSTTQSAAMSRGSQEPLAKLGNTMVRRSLLAPIAVAIAAAGARVEAPGAMVEETLPDDHPAVSSAARREGGCWDETMPGAFLEMGESTAAAMEQAADSKADWQKTYNWFYNDRLTPAGNLPNKWAAVQKLGMAGSEAQPSHPEWANAFPGKGLDMSLWGPLLGQMPSFAGALFGRSLFSGCKCEGLRPRPSPQTRRRPRRSHPPLRAQRASIRSIRW